MKLFEFVDDDPLRVKLTAVCSQLKDQVIKSGKTLSTDEFIAKLQQHGISLDPSDLFDLIKKEPLKNIIADISGHTVIFKGQSGEMDVGSDEDKNRETISNMAKKALK
jgi:hypothetical protein